MVMMAYQYEMLELSFPADANPQPMPELTAADSFLESLPGRLQAIANQTINPAKDNLVKISAEAAKLGINPAIIRRAADMLDNEQIDRMAETYADRFGTGRLPEKLAYSAIQSLIETLSKSEVEKSQPVILQERKEHLRKTHSFMEVFEKSQ